ncbi:MAG: dienelactone hydrolase family protein [Chloroflexi bacterium]|nr:dienelactone hydrolase family protein [Chloroflexota bacterium]
MVTPSDDTGAAALRVDGKAVRAYWTEPAPGIPDAGWAFAYAPGAGSNIDDPYGRFLGAALSTAGIPVLRFQFSYQQERRRFPDKPPILEATWRSAIAAARGKRERLAVGGRSMGGRYASYVVAQGEPVDAVVCFAYPLHPPGKPEETRDEHLSLIKVPLLVCSGSRDAFGTPDELRAGLSKAQGSTLHLLAGADHGFNVLKSSGRTREDVWREATQTTIEWLVGFPTS